MHREETAQSTFYAAGYRPRQSGYGSIANQGSDTNHQSYLSIDSSIYEKLLSGWGNRNWNTSVWKLMIQHDLIYFYDKYTLCAVFELTLGIKMIIGSR